MDQPKDLVLASNLRGLEADLDSLIGRVYNFRRDESRTGTPAAEVFSKIELTHSLLECKDTLNKLADSINVELEKNKLNIPICRCRLDGDTYDISRCPLHVVDHVYNSGCCDQPEKAHRHATSAEYERIYPTVFDQRFTTNNATYRVDARNYHDRIGVTITQLFFNDDGDDHDTGTGLCFDLPLDAIGPLIRVLQELVLTEIS